MNIELPLTQKQLAERMHEYRERIAPIVKAMAAIEALRPPRAVLLHADGSMELGDDQPLPAELEMQLGESRALIKDIQRSLFPRANLEPQG